MKRFLSFAFAALFLLTGLNACSSTDSEEEGLTVAATTYPLFLLASAVAEGAEDITIVPVINQSVACLHDYTLTVTDMKILEGADVVLCNGAGLEDFLDDALEGKPTVDCSTGVPLLMGDEDGEEEVDPHIWMDPDRAAIMVMNIADGLAEVDPDNAQLYQENGQQEAADLSDFADECREALSDLDCRELVTFHEGFAYFADSMDLEILAAVEEESGSEASAKEIVNIVSLIDEYELPAIFVEENGSDATASAIQRECGVEIYSLTMMMSGPEEYSSENNYQTVMWKNIEVLQEALS